MPFTTIKNIWEKVSSIGLSAEYSFDENIKIRNLNQACLITQITFLLTIIQNYYFKQPFLIYISIFSFAFLFLIYLLNQKRLHKFSLYIFVFYIMLSVFVSNNYASNDSGIYLFLFSILHGIAFLFYLPHEKSELALIVCLNILFIAITFLFPDFHLFESFKLSPHIKIQFLYNVFSTIGFNVGLILIVQENKRKLNLNLKQSLEAVQNTNKALQKIVKDKDILMAELHHRVKNNLALINGILTLQSKDTVNEETLMVISESKNRIRSMAILHDKLYLKNSFDDVNLAAYIKEIVEQINVSIIEADNIELYMKLDDVIVDISKGISIGLIVNEIITNSLKHAFNNKNSTGIIEVQLKKGPKNHLKIIDNGKGLDEMVKRKNATSMGINIIGSLVDQIDGSYSINTDKGTYFDLYF
jgi:two-component sensor histidine kinase